MKTLMFVIVCALLSNNVYAESYGNYGFVVSGSGSPNTFSQRTYEWGWDGVGSNGNCYCFHGAGSTAINIRMGKRSTTTESVYNYFVDDLNAYQSKDACHTSSQDWLNASNRYHISDLNIYKKPSSGYFPSKTALWNEMKNNIDNNKPMLIPLKQWKAVYDSNKPYNEVTSYTGNIGHAVIVVGYINFDSKLIAIRDPAIESASLKHKYKYLFDYTISLDTLNNEIQSLQVIVFNTKTNADLKSMKISSGTQNEPGSSCGSGKVYDCKMTCVNESTAKSWTGDGYCDNGKYQSDGVFYNLVCPVFNNDGGDCN